jgi:hypothetical protein
MILSCNSTNPSIWGVALSWKYNPQGLGASQILNTRHWLNIKTDN